MSEAKTIVTSDGVTLAYHHSAGDAPGVVFLGGFRSDMIGTKATALENYCTAQGRAFTRFDYRGHGESGGEFIEATLSDWLGDALSVIDEVTSGDLILVGSSMGGHIMLHTALARPDRVKGLIGIAAATDFTEVLMWERADEARRAELEEKGVVWLPSDYSDQPYAITMKLIDDGRKHLLFEREDIALDIPVSLLHGLIDDDVPWELSMLTAAHLRSNKVDIHFVKDADHRFSRPQDIALLKETLERMVKQSP